MTAPEIDEAPPPRRRRPLRAIGLALLLLLALFAAIVASIDTGPGHRLIVDRIASLRIKTGLRVRIGRIDGSIWRHAVLRDVRLYDLDGQFFRSPEIRLDWHPLQWARNRLVIDAVAARSAGLDRLPRLRKGGEGPTLPGFDILIGRLAVDRLSLGKPVAGTPAVLALRARADIRHGRAMIGLAAASDKGDRVRLDLDAMPDGDRFRLEGDVSGPGQGTIASLLGTRLPFAASVSGQGGWQRWDGRARARSGSRSVAALTLAARAGRYTLGGELGLSAFLTGKGQRLTAPRIRVAGSATYGDRQLDGRIQLRSAALALAAAGRIDLAQSRFAGVKIDTRLLRPAALFPNMSGADVHLALALDGPFRTAAFRYALTSPHIAFDDTGFDGVRAAGAGRFSPAPVVVPIRLSAARVTGLGPEAGGILGNLAVAGVLKVDSKLLVGTGLALSSDKLKGRLGLRVDLVTGRYDIALSGGLQRYLIPGLGIVDVDSVLQALPGPGGVGTVVAGQGQAAVRRFDNMFLRTLAGGLPRIDTSLTRDATGVLHFPQLTLAAPAIRITGSGLRRKDGSFQFEGTGQQATYGRFRLSLDGMIDHPTVRLQLDSPVPALGLSQVRLELDPIADGFAFRAAGGSTLGPFTATGAIRTPPGGATTIEVASLAVSDTRARGSLRSDPAGFTGRLEVAGGGMAGTIDFAPQGTIQRIDPHLALANATFATDTPITVRKGRIDGTVLLDPAATIVNVTAVGAGVHRGGLSFARASIATRLRGDMGTVEASVSGSRGRAFNLGGRAKIAPDRVSVAANGSVEGQALVFAAPLVFTREGDGWRLAPMNATFRGGSVRGGGVFGGTRTGLDLTLDRLPMSLLDILSPTLGLGGTGSGHLAYQAQDGQPPVGSLDMTLRGLTRSGLVLSSQPIDLALAGRLGPQGLALRMVAAAQGRTIGRAQARLAPLGPGADMAARLSSAPLFAQLRYAGPADALWRLIGVETIDLSGPISIGADIGGTVANPSIRGTLATDAGRLESTVTGTLIRNIRAHGSFAGSRLTLDTLAGSTANGGTVTGRGAFDFANLAKGVGMDLQLQAANAQLLQRDDVGATVTGPLTIRSSGAGGTIGGNLVLERSRYQLGAAAVAQVAHLNTRELNRPDSDEADQTPPVPWQLDIKARAPGLLMVRGLGMDSIWRANLSIKGAVDNPAISGQVNLVEGGYQFAGRRFELERGVIRFSGETPVDPILDITAQANLEGLNASIHVSGTSSKPQIDFESVPQLPEDELLSRLLFGTSITNLSAPEALQLAAAVANLRGQGGGTGINLDPINAVRKAVRLDRLRILPADVTTGQKTSVAAGKYIGRRTYVEVITDGAGYSATSVEFRITRWLSLLSTISTIGRQSANVRVSKDY